MTKRHATFLVEGLPALLTVFGVDTEANQTTGNGTHG
jgi:hypothetical protein